MDANPFRMSVVAAAGSSKKISLRQITTKPNSIRFLALKHTYFPPYTMEEFKARYKEHLQTSPELTKIYSSRSPYVHVIDFFLNEPKDPFLRDIKKYKMSLKNSLNSMLSRRCENLVIGFYTDDRPFLVESC
jgi:hypothetical protein